MIIQLAVLFTLVGIAVGSFLNVCIDRLPLRKSLVSPPSHCDSCQRKLGLIDLIPIISYLILAGKCRYCGARIPIRVFLVEFFTGALFLLAYWQYGLSAQFGITAFWCCVFMVIIFIDWEHKLILNIITYPAMIIAAVVLVLHTYTDVTFKVDDCAGYAQARPYTRVRVKNSKTMAWVTIWGPPFSIG